MNPITVPRLYCPITPAVNPHAADVASRTDAWVRRFDLYPGEAWQLYQDSHVPQLTARIFPTADLEKLALANDLVALLFALYDLFSGQHPRLDMEERKLRFRQITTAVSTVTTGGSLTAHRSLTTGGSVPGADLAADSGYPASGISSSDISSSDISGSSANNIPTAFADIWERLQTFCPPQISQQFALNFLFLLKATNEALDNGYAHTPTISQYVESRRRGCTAPITMDLLTVIEDIPLSQERFEHPELRQLVTLGRHIICWANDLFYLGRRYPGEGHDLISLLQSERKLSLDEAILCTIAMHDADMLKFMRLSKQLPFMDTTVERYIAALGRHVRGNVDWSLLDTGRYYFRNKA